MSYKFKIGPAILSGSNVFKESVDVQSTLGATELSSSDKLKVGGQVVLDGVTDIGNSLAVGEDSLYFRDATTTLMRRVTIDKFAESIAGDGLSDSSGVLAVGVDDSTIETDSDVLRIKDNGVTLAKLAGITRGSIILGDSSGDPSLLAKGTAAQFLQSDGTDPSYVSISGDATVAAGGALSIGDEKVVNDMLKTGSVDTANLAAAAVTAAKIATAVAGDGLAGGGGSALSVNVDGSGIEINSDTLRLKDNGVTLAKLAGITRGSIILGDSSGDPSLLAKGTAAQFLQSDGTDPSYVSISGDATVAAGGVLSIGDEKVVNDMLKTGSVDTANLAAAAVTAAKIATAVAGDGLAGGGGSALSVNVDDTGIELDSDALRLKDLGVVTAKLANRGVTSAKIALGGVTQDNYGTGSVQTAHLADDAVTLAKLDAIAQGSLIVGGSSNAPTALNAKASGQILVGDGTDVASVAVSGDATLAANGALTIAAGAVEHGMLNDNVIFGQGELSTLADADDMLIHDATDSVVKRVGLDTLAKFFRGMTVNPLGNANGSLVEGLNFSTASIASSNKTYTLPASADLSAGDQVLVKAGEIASGIRLVISASGDQTIDQQTGSIDLLDDGAAVTLVYGGSDKWFIV